MNPEPQSLVSRSFLAGHQQHCAEETWNHFTSGKAEAQRAEDQHSWGDGVTLSVRML